MNQNTIQMLFALVRSAITGNRLTEQERSWYNDGILPDLMSISKKHDIAHLVATGLKTNGLLTEKDKKISEEIFKAVFRYEQLNCEYEKLCEVLEKACIAFLPLKGSVIQKYYREPWMRTSCDIDILVREKTVDTAAEYLVNNCEYSLKGKGSHDISLFTPNDNHIELHYDLVEDGLINNSSEVLKSVWNTASVCDGHRYRMEMPDEMFYFYHIAHMAKHFRHGGCGIRPFIDLWILDDIDDADKKKRNELLRQGDLLKFAETAEHLSEVWFENKNHDDVTKQMEQYILRGGVYGTAENRIAVQRQKKGGHFMYVLSKIFVPYEIIKFYYPILQKHRWLTPIMEVRRWCRILFCGQAKQGVRELKYSRNVPDIDAANTKQFLNAIGL